MSSSQTALPTRLREIIATAAAKRAPVARLLNGLGDGAEFSGLIIDRFESNAIVHTYSDEWYNRRLEIAEILATIKIQHAVLWHRDSDPKETTKRGAEIILGSPPEKTTVTVDGVKLLLKPFKTASGGIFLDTRDIRCELISQSKGKRVLNLFSFTGSLGLAAAIGGAREVTQIDNSQSVLDWSKENAALQPELLSSTIIKYITDDALTVLQRCARRREKGTDAVGYDVIIIDPPAFGASGSKRFDLSAQMSDLLEAALVAASVSSTIYLLCNETSITPDLLSSLVPRGLNVREVRAPIDTHPGDIAVQSVMRGIVIGS